MPKTLTVSQIQRIEKHAISTIGIPSVVLMENAGRAVAESLLRELEVKERTNIAVICGTGNNGGDGFVAARYLWAAGVNVTVFVLGNIKVLKQGPKVFYAILKALRVPVVLIKKWDRSTADFINGHDIFVDALLGIGINRPVSGELEQMIDLINDSRQKIWSVDIPSGLDGTTGKVYGSCVKAATTVSFTALKKGFFINEGPSLTGRIQTADIGIPEVLLRKFG